MLADSESIVSLLYVIFEVDAEVANVCWFAQDKNRWYVFEMN